MIKKLNLTDATLTVAGSMIGSGIFIVSADMARTVGSPGWLLLLWVLAGAMTVMAALSYGELAAMFPKAGGQYVYLKEAYNPLTGFLYGWTLFTVIQSGTIAAVAVAFAKFAGVLMPVFSENNILLSLGSFHISAAQLLGIVSILALTYINSLGIHYGKIIIRIFSSAKLLALFGLIILGIFVFSNANVWHINLQNFWSAASYSVGIDGKSVNILPLSGMALMAALGAGMVGSLFSSDAWNNVTFISADIENPHRNLPLSLLFGTLIVSAIYILANVAYLHVLPFMGTPNSSDYYTAGIQFAPNDRVGVSAANMIFGGAGTAIMAVLIMISTFGCNNSIVLSSVRVYQEMSRDGLFFSKMKENNANGVPGFALWVQFGWAALLCLSGKYGALLDYVMFSVMLFYIFTIAGIFILRKKMPTAERPYKAWGYPVLPAIYMLLAAAFCINLLITKPENTWPGLFIVVLGVPVYYYWKMKKTKV